MIRVDKAFTDNISDGNDRERVEKLNKSVFTLGIGQSWYICIGSDLQMEQMGEEVLHINIKYSDSNSTYTDEISIDLLQFFWALIYDSPLEDMYQQSKEVNAHLKSIATNLKSSSGENTVCRLPTNH